MKKCLVFTILLFCYPIYSMNGNPKIKIQIKEILEGQPSKNDERLCEFLSLVSSSDKYNDELKSLLEYGVNPCNEDRSSLALYNAFAFKAIKNIKLLISHIYRYQINEDDLIQYVEVIGYPNYEKNVESIRRALINILKQNNSLENDTKDRKRKREDTHHLQKCDYCNLTEENREIKLKLCSKCQNTYYCNKYCQNKDWKNHKYICREQKRYSTFACFHCHKGQRDKSIIISCDLCKRKFWCSEECHNLDKQKHENSYLCSNKDGSDPLKFYGQIPKFPF